MSVKLQRRASISGLRNRTTDSPGMTLDDYYHTVAKTILCNHNPLTGLFSAGKDTDHAWVRDNVYAIMAVWGLSLSYKKHLDQMENWTKCYELEQVRDLTNGSLVRSFVRMLRRSLLTIDRCEDHAWFVNVHDETSGQSREIQIHLEPRRCIAREVFVRDR